MKEKIKYLMGKKAFHKILISIIVAIILLFLAFTLIRYSVEGETNMPFNLTKIIMISSTEGIEKEAVESKWAFDVSQNTDIYIYLEKNEKYKEKAIIKNILIDNINLEKEQKKGEINIYRPNIDETGAAFKNSEQNLAETIEYQGAMEANLKELKIANQGGVVIFRCANDKIAEYKSDEEEINHNQLLQKCQLTR